MNSELSPVRVDPDAPSQCKICGASASHSNYGARSCFACKMFFKRYGDKPGGEQMRCHFDGLCDITIFNRHACAACRLSKCFATGMQAELIRCPISKNHRPKPQAKQSPVGNLLRTDRSTLSPDQWNLLSNLMHCYDEHTGLQITERFIIAENILPLKARFKCASVKHFLASLLEHVELVFTKNADFRSLSSSDCSFLLRRQMKYVCLLSASFHMHQTHLLDYSAFYQTSELLFGSTAMVILRQLVALVNVDVPFLKMTLALICFSPWKDPPTQTDELTNIEMITRIQEKYIELTWRYLVQVYEHRRAVIYFAGLIRCLFRIDDFLVNTRETSIFDSIFESLVHLSLNRFV